MFLVAVSFPIQRNVQCKTYFEWWLFILKIHYLFGITFTCMCKWMRKASFFMQQQSAANKCEKFRYGWKRVSFQFKYTHSVVIWHFANEKPMRFGCADYVPFQWFFAYPRLNREYFNHCSREMPHYFVAERAFQTVNYQNNYRMRWTLHYIVRASDSIYSRRNLHVTGLIFHCILFLVSFQSIDRGDWSG